MAGYSFGGRSRDNRPRNEIIGNVTLRVESFDHEANAATGVTRDGEIMTIRLADKDEFADMFVNRTKNTTQDARERLAAKQTGNRPDMATLEAKMQEGHGTIQFQSVVQRPEQNDLVARWMESVTTKVEDSYVQGMARIQVPRSNDETAGKTERRRADVILPDTATTATMATLDDFTANRITGDEGKRLDADVRSAVVIAVQAENDPSETPTSFMWTTWNKEKQELERGGQSLFERPLNQHNWETVVPLAAQVGVPFEDLSFDNERVNANDRGNAEHLYHATQEGHIKVVVAQGFTSETMPRLRDKLVTTEKMAIESEGRRVSMADRGFFAADVGLRLREGSDGYKDQVAVKEILANEFLVPKAEESYSPRSLTAMGAELVNAAEANGLILTTEPTPEPAPAPEPEPEPDADAERKPVPSFAPDM